MLEKQMTVFQGDAAQSTEKRSKGENSNQCLTTLAGRRRGAGAEGIKVALNLSLFDTLERLIDSGVQRLIGNNQVESRELLGRGKLVVNVGGISYAKKETYWVFPDKDGKLDTVHQTSAPRRNTDLACAQQKTLEGNLILGVDGLLNLWFLRTE